MRGDLANGVRTCHRARIYVGNVHLRTKLHSDSDIERDGMVNTAGLQPSVMALR